MKLKITKKTQPLLNSADKKKILKRVAEAAQSAIADAINESVGYAASFSPTVYLTDQGIDIVFFSDEFAEINSGILFRWEDIMRENAGFIDDGRKTAAGLRRMADWCEGKQDASPPPS